MRKSLWIAPSAKRHASRARVRWLTLENWQRQQKRKLLGFYAHVREFSKVLIEGSYWRVLDRSGCG
jgi:hypothetical protein